MNRLDMEPRGQLTLDGQRIARAHGVLHQILRVIMGVKSRDELFHEVCRIGVERGGYAMAWVGWHDPVSKSLVPVAQRGDATDFLETNKLFSDERPEGRGLGGLAFSSGQTYICNDLCNDPLTRLWHAEAMKREYHAVGVVPLRLHGTVCGIFVAYADAAGFFRTEEIGLLEDLGSAISFVLDNLERQGNGAVGNGGVGHVAAAGKGARNHGGGARERAVSNSAAGNGAAGNGAAGNGAAGNGAAGHDPVVSDGAPDRPVDIKKVRASAQLEARVLERTAELRAAKDRAEAANQRKSAFLATMSHELRTPLHAMMGFTGILLQKASGPLNQEQVKQLETVLGCARTLLGLVNDILDISKIETGQMEVFTEVFDLASSVNRVTAIAQPLADKKGLTLRVELSPTLGQLATDQRRFEQILLNLLYNAIKFTDRGEIKVVGEIVNDKVGNPCARLRVVDSGIGIRPEDIATVFKPFRQVDTGKKRHDEGSGLGLAICRQLSDLLGGDLDVESVYGAGSVFTLSLPLNRSPVPM
jgi:signal transduction histidine kinase